MFFKKVFLSFLYFIRKSYLFKTFFLWYNTFLSIYILIYINISYFKKTHIHSNPVLAVDNFATLQGLCQEKRQKTAQD